MPEIKRGVAAKRNEAERIARAVGPAAVVPRTGHEIIQVVGVFLFEQFVNLHGTIKIFLVPPAGDVQVGNSGPREKVGHGLLLPEGVVVGVRDEVAPGGKPAVNVFLVGVRKRAELQVPIVGVEAVELEREVRFVGLHHRGIFVAVAQAEGAVVVKIIAQEHVGGRGLLGNSFERGMRLEHAHHREPATVGDAQEADAAVVVRNVFDEPCNGVVRVRAFVDGFRIFWIAQRPLHDEFALRAVAAANVLKHEDVAVRNHLGVAAELAAVALFVVAQAIGRALKDDGQRFGGVLRGIDFTVELHAVAGGDHDVGLVEERGVIGTFLLRSGDERKEKKTQRQADEFAAARQGHDGAPGRVFHDSADGNPGNADELITGRPMDAVVTTVQGAPAR